MLETIGAVCGVLAVVGVVLNNYRLRACFLLWMVSNCLSAGIHAYAGVWSLFGRDIVFLLLAFHGFYQWRKK